MRKLYILCVVALAAFIIGLAWADEITLTTYYPAPYGVYNVLRLAPQTSVPSGVKGDMYVDDATGGLWVHNGTAWKEVDYVP